jgi:ATP-dependent 26S proteasome regulatory subunit
MGMDKYTQDIIKKVASNDMSGIRKASIQALDADKTQKNSWFVNKYKSILTSSGANLIELPHSLKEILICEDVSVSFNEKRYYLTEREKSMRDEIIKMSKVSQKMMELQIPYKNATLLYGNPGIGKTMFGRYMAYKMNLKFLYLNLSRIVGASIGSTSINISNAFSYASINPCVFMLDEIDSISTKRSGSLGDSAEKEMARITITLMQELDRISSDVVIISATNRIDILDEAFINRFSSKYEMFPFTREENLRMIDKFLKDIGIEISTKQKEEVLQNKDQREVMNCLIKKIASIIEKEGD